MNPAAGPPEILFVSGVARSGTSALVLVLNSHKQMLIGQERYAHLVNSHQITEAHFRLPRFLDRQPQDTHALAGHLGEPERALEKYQRARFVGDKFPNLFKHFDFVFETFPQAVHVYILRNPLSVIESFDKRARDPNDPWTHPWESGLADWNTSVRRIADLPPHLRDRMVLLPYETLFASVEQLARPFTALGLEPPPAKRLEPFVTKFGQLMDSDGPRRETLRAAVSRGADWDAYRRVCDLIDERGPGWQMAGRSGQASTP